MAITTLDQALAGMQPPVWFDKSLTPALLSGRPQSLWYLNGIPGPGTTDIATGNGVVLSAPVAGQIPFTNPVSGNTYLSMLRGVNATQSGVVLLCDRLLTCGAITTNAPISVTSTASQTLNTGALPARDNAGGTNGVGVYAGIEVVNALGAGAPTITLGYTNSAGTAGQAATNDFAVSASSPIGAFYPIGLAGGDVGVKSVETLQLSATMTTGNIALVLYRVLAAVETPLAYTGCSPLNLATGGFQQMFNNTVPFLIFIPNTSSATAVRGHAGWTQG